MEALSPELNARAAHHTRAPPGHKGRASPLLWPIVLLTWHCNETHRACLELMLEQKPAHFFPQAIQSLFPGSVH